MMLEKGWAEYGDRFAALWGKWGAHTDWHAAFAQLQASYSEPWRHYHTFRHIAHCLREFDLAASSIADAEALEVALWFHDAVYIPGNRDNERKSADYFSQISQGRLPADIEVQVRQLILITEHVDSPTTQAECYMVDIDLSPFGIPWEQCLEDSKRVRKELMMVADAEYFQTNLKFLQSLVDRPHLYRTPYFQGRYEQSARYNIGRLMERIDSAGTL